MERRLKDIGGRGGDLSNPVLVACGLWHIWECGNVGIWGFLFLPFSFRAHHTTPRHRGTLLRALGIKLNAGTG